MENRIEMQHKKYSIRIETLIQAIIALFFFMPDDFFSFATIYSCKTPDDISYKWLDYHFGIFALLIVVFGIVQLILHKNVKPFLWMVALLVREICFLFLGEPNVFTAGCFETLLSLSVGALLAFSLMYNCSSVQRYENVFWLIVYLNLFTVYVNFILGKNGIAGRYNAINLDVGTTGVFCAVALIHFYANSTPKENTMKYLVIIGALFLSGSRVTLLLATFVIGVLWLVKRRNYIQKSGLINKIGTLFLFVIITVLVYLLGGDSFRERLFSMSSRSLSVFSLSNMAVDSSTMGRMNSLMAAVGVIKEHPFGISAFFVNQQRLMTEQGFRTFPHFTVIYLYILFGPFALVLYTYVLKLFVKIRHVDRSSFFVLLFIILYSVVAGGAIVNFKIFAFYTSIILLAHLKLKEKGRNKQ